MSASAPGDGALLVLNDVSKRFGGLRAVSDLHLTVAAGSCAA